MMMDGLLVNGLRALVVRRVRVRAWSVVSIERAEYPRILSKIYDLDGVREEYTPKAMTLIGLSYRSMPV